MRLPHEAIPSASTTLIGCWLLEIQSRSVPIAATDDQEQRKIIALQAIAETLQMILNELKAMRLARK